MWGSASLNVCRSYRIFSTKTPISVWNSLKPRLQEQFLGDNFYVTIFICSCRRGKLANFYVTNTFAEKLAC